MANEPRNSSERLGRNFVLRQNLGYCQICTALPLFLLFLFLSDFDSIHLISVVNRDLSLQENSSTDECQGKFWLQLSNSITKTKQQLLQLWRVIETYSMVHFFPNLFLLRDSSEEIIIIIDFLMYLQSKVIEYCGIGVLLCANSIVLPKLAER